MGTLPIRLIREYLRRQVFPMAVAKYVASLIPVQKEVFESPARFKAVHAGRRGGKTHLGRVAAVAAAAEHPESFIPIFERSSTSFAARVMWSELRKDNQRWALGLTFNETTKIVSCPNGSKIGIIGVDKLDDTEKARGDKHPFVLVDEAGTFRPLVLLTLYRDVIRPALVDLMGSLLLVGTPNESCMGAFHDACLEGSAFQVWEWDMRDNPYIKNAASEMEAVLKEQGWAWEDPSFQREWLGQWVFDSSNRVYHFDPKYNIEEPPKDLDCHVMGIDLGWDDDTAFVMLGFYRHHTDRIWVVDAWKRKEMISDEIAQEVRTFIDKYKPDAIVGDTGGLGKTIVKELNRRHSIPIKAAEKTKKNAYIRILNSDLRTRRLMIAPRLKDLQEELRSLQWAPIKFRSDVKKIAEGCDDHEADALLYSWREATHWVNEKKKPEVPQMETPEYEDYLEEQQEELERRPDRSGTFDQGLPDSDLVWQHEPEPDPFENETLDA